MMELKKVTDASGKTISIIEYKGRLYPPFPREALLGIETFSARSDDVIVCAYPSSGTNWTWEMVRILLAGTIDVPNTEKLAGMIEFTVPDVLQKMDSPRCLNTHVHFEMLSQDVFNQKSKIIYITRDPRDVAVSLYNHHRNLHIFNYDGEWKDYLPLFLEGKLQFESLFSYTRGWEQGIKDHPDMPVLVTSYEALHADAKGELKKMVNFLGLSHSDDFLDQVVNKCSFDSMRRTKGPQHVVKGTDKSAIFRTGKTGAWKNWFTVAQYELFDSVFEQEMVGTQSHSLYTHSGKK